MHMDDLILVSVDDHVVEPPDMFDGHIPAEYRDEAPKVITKPDGTDSWVFEGQEATNVGLNAVAGRPPHEWGAESFTWSAWFVLWVTGPTQRVVVLTKGTRITGWMTALLSTLR
jgi:hypothetical protein